MSAVISLDVNTLHPYATVSTVRNAPEAADSVIAMHRDDLKRLDGDHRWRMIVCREGTIWITQERDWRDYVLEPGDVFVVTRRGQVLIEALEDALVDITPSLRTAPYRGAVPVFH